MIKFYTLNCPKCKVLEKKLQQKDIKFEIVDNTDDVVVIGKQYGISTAPFMIIDNEVYDFKKAIEWVNNYGN